jgi:hypothetical protein
LQILPLSGITAFPFDPFNLKTEVKYGTNVNTKLSNYLRLLSGCEEID